MELEDQQRRDMIERQQADMIRHIVSSPEYPSQAFRAMRPPSSKTQWSNLFGTHSDNISYYIIKHNNN